MVRRESASRESRRDHDIMCRAALCRRGWWDGYLCHLLEWLFVCRCDYLTSPLCLP